MAGIALLPAFLTGIEYTGEIILYDDAPVSADLRRAGFFVPEYMGPVSTVEVLARMPALEIVQLLTAGFEYVLPYLPNGVKLCNAAGVHDASTAELAVGLILASLRGLDVAARSMESGAWVHETRPSLADRQVLILGAGGVGQAVRRRIEPFEATVTMIGRTGRPGVLAIADLDSILPSADVVVLAVPLDASTRGLVDSKFLALMKTGALLVNVSRGPVVDTDALIAGLQGGGISAALDVTDPEPLPPGHRLWSCPNLLISAHVGGDTSAFAPRARALVSDQLTSWATGQPMRNIIPTA
ncbi:dehydrogenase [Actinomycetes bacterium]|nr:dehydrogenase [Actinomycetes bacterium]